MKTLLTGSRVYGTPSAKSDLDVVCWVTPLEYGIIVTIADKVYEDEYDEKGIAHVRFGMLNLILVRDAKTFAAWDRGTRELIARRPVTRAQAVQHMDRLRAGESP